jgi:hypothetical protein
MVCVTSGTPSARTEKEQIMARTGTTIAAALATLAVAAPLAAARPIDRGYVAPKQVHAATAQKVITQDSGFDWLDAAIGAAVAAGVFSLTGAGVLVVRRPRGDANAALGAH